MAADGSKWGTWLRECLDQRRWRPAELTRRSAGRIESSQVTRWLRSGQAPGRDSVRVVCEVLGVPVRDGLVAAGLVDSADIGAQVVVQGRSIEDVSDAALLEELSRRLRVAATGGFAAVRPSVGPLEWPKQAAPSRQSDSKDDVNRA